MKAKAKTSTGKTRSNQLRARRNDLTIVGRRVGLGPARPDLEPVYFRWVEEWQRVESILEPPPLPPIMITAAGPTAWSAGDWPDEAWFTIYELEELRPIGHLALLDIDLLDDTASLLLFIGEPWARGKGFGTEALKLMVDYAFQVLELQTMETIIGEFNLAGLRAYTRAGFHEVERRRRIYQGMLWNDIVLECQAIDQVSPLLRGFSTLPQMRSHL